MIGRPPSSPLFPYRALFGSGRAVEADAGQGGRPAAEAAEEDVGGAVGVGGGGQVRGVADPGDGPNVGRVNGLHTRTSYAVFCFSNLTQPRGGASVGVAGGEP